jgi:hypothetical protein
MTKPAMPPRADIHTQNVTRFDYRAEDHEENAIDVGGRILECKHRARLIRHDGHDFGHAPS